MGGVGVKQNFYSKTSVQINICGKSCNGCHRLGIVILTVNRQNNIWIPPKLNESTDIIIIFQESDLNAFPLYFKEIKLIQNNFFIFFYLNICHQPWAIIKSDVLN